MSNWHERDGVKVLDELNTDLTGGLTEDEATLRRAQYGLNELVERGVKSIWKILWEQLTATLVVVLIVAAVVSIILGDYDDAIAIMAIVVLNAMIGLRQEYKAEQAMAALKRMAVPVVKTRRGGHVVELSARQLVPGDVVLLEAGGAVPADGRLLESRNLQIQEAALTGESLPVEKDSRKRFEADQPLADRLNMMYMGTVISNGRGLAVITETGMSTELGHIADMIQGVQSEPTPLQRRLDRLARSLAIVALALVAIVFCLGWWQSGEVTKEMFLTAVSLAVAAVPEGLPAVVTIALAIGAQRMLKRNALIRKLPAVETLGSVTTICSDKTGTLTRNEMTVTVLDVAGQRLDVKPNAQVDSSLCDQPSLALMIAGGALCNDALLDVDDSADEAVHAVGDPTEGALIVAAMRAGLKKEDLEAVLPRVNEAPFDSDRKRMTTVHRVAKDTTPPCHGLGVWWPSGETPPAPTVIITKGALDSILEITTAVFGGTSVEALNDDWRKRIWEAHDRLAGDGVRVLGVGYRVTDESPDDLDQAAMERDLTFVGLVGLIDPPRQEAADAVQTCRAAGIRPVMITGDHPLTARYIGSQLGINADGGVMTGRQLNELSEEQLQDVVEKTSIFARVSPEHKLQLVSALQDNGHVVAMTGDGVNDAPALKQADIGVAMGITGTDVAKEAADAVLRDDNFATIVAAVKEGRVVYDNIRKFIKYTMTSNAGEIWVMMLAPLFGLPLPLLPLQILWVNLVTDGLPGLALALEPGERNTMRRGPYPPGESIFARGLGIDIIWIGILMGAVSFGAGYWYYGSETLDPGYWRTMVFTVLTLSQMGNALAIRSERDSLFRIGLFSNKALLGSVLLTLGLQIAVIYTPFFQNYLETTALSATDLLICFALSTIIFWAVEAKKVLLRRSAGVTESWRGGVVE